MSTDEHGNVAFPLGNVSPANEYRPLRDLIGEVEQASVGNAILRVGQENTPGGNWSQSAHVVLTPVEREVLIAALIEQRKQAPVVESGPVRKFLDLSTGHLPLRLMADGELVGIDGVVAEQLEHGWLMWVPDDPDVHAEGYGTVDEDVLVVQRYARARGCDYVRFDADADQAPGLQFWG